MIRVRSGFVQNVFGFNLTKEAAPGYKLGGRFALWVGASNERKPVLGQPPAVEAREAYLKLEAPWGTIQAGRALGLFGRGGIIMDAEIVHANGLGSPCSTRVILGGACGFAGHGVLFPAFNAGFLYNTPSLAGFQVTLGLYDPSVNSEKQYEITPYPRLEAQIAYNFRGIFKLFGEAMWQRLINTNPVRDAATGARPVLDASGRPLRQVADVNGVAAGAQLAVGPLQVGGSFYQGKGLTLIIPIFNTPIFTDQNVIRSCAGARVRRHGFAHLRRHEDRGRRRYFSAQADVVRAGALFDAGPSQAATRHLDRPLPDVLQAADVGHRIFPRAIHLVPYQRPPAIRSSRQNRTSTSSIRV